MFLKKLSELTWVWIIESLSKQFTSAKVYKRTTERRRRLAHRAKVIGHVEGAAAAAVRQCVEPVEQVTLAGVVVF